MPIEFDPYLEWLGIQSTERPLDHYALLGLTRFESSEALIDQHSVQRIELLQDIATGSEQVEISQKILNEVSAARVCLLDRQKRIKYDLQLKKQLAGFDSAESRLARFTSNADSADPRESPAKESPAKPVAPISLAISTDLESKKRKSGENPIPRINKRKKPWVFPVVAMIIPLLMGIGVLLGVYIFLTPQLREDFDKLNYGRSNVIETSHDEASLGDPLKLNPAQLPKPTTPPKSTKNPKRKKSSPKKVAVPTDSGGKIIASFYADPAMVGGNNAKSPIALDPEEQKWIYRGSSTDFSEPVPAKNTTIAAWKTGDEEFDGVDFHQVISADDFDRLYENGWQLTVIAKLVAGSYRFQLIPNLEATYWKRDNAESPYGTYSIHLNKSPDKKTKISVAGNEKSQITLNDPHQYVKIELKCPPEQANCTFRVYPLTDGQEAARPIAKKENLKPAYQKWPRPKSSQIRMITTGPRKDDQKSKKKPRTTLSEIWIHKVELKALK